MLIYRIPHSVFAILNAIVDCIGSFRTSVEIGVLDQNIEHLVQKEQFKNTKADALNPSGRQSLNDWYSWRGITLDLGLSSTIAQLLISECNKAR